MKYLKSKQHYIDLYDLHTIEECLDLYKSLWNKVLEERNRFKEDSDKKFKEESNKCISYIINVVRGEKFRHKKETIDKWMEKDKKMQDIVDSAKPPEVTCKKCKSSLTMRLISSDLTNSYEENAQMLYMFECLKCKKREAYWEDGTKWKYKPDLCPKCKSSLKTEKVEDKKDVLTIIIKCSNCSYTKKDINDFKKYEKDRKLKAKREKNLLKKYRHIFCYSDKDGQEYINCIDGLKQLFAEIDEQKKKDQDPIYKKVRKLKRLTVDQLEKRLKNVLSKKKYNKLTFDKPDIDRFVIVPFTTQDSDSKRDKKDSIYKLQRLIKSTLKDTNWRLMSDGINYRLGYLSGRLKGYEREEDIYKLAKQQRIYKEEKTGE